MSRIIENVDNVGFGAAVNQGIRASSTPFVAVLNDDTVTDPGWLEAMLRALEGRPDVGMVAPQIRLGIHRHAGQRRHAGVRRWQQPSARAW